MIYRSTKAQAIHTALIDYLRDPSEKRFATFCASIEASDEESLSERSKHGHSHLVDLFHLAKEFCPVGVEIAPGVSRAFDVIMQKAQHYPNVRAMLLFASCDEGFSRQILIRSATVKKAVYSGSWGT